MIKPTESSKYVRDPYKRGGWRKKLADSGRGGADNWMPKNDPKWLPKVGAKKWMPKRGVRGGKSWLIAGEKKRSR